MSFVKIVICTVCLLVAQLACSFAVEGISQTHLLYIRHGEVPGNNPHPSTYIYTGSGTDQSLTEKGKVQAQDCAALIFKLQAGGKIGNVTAVYASDLKRAMETAQPIAEQLGLEVQVRGNLREINWGSADGELVHAMEEKWGALEKSIKQQYPERTERWDHLPVFEGAETYNVLLKRNLDELQAIAESHPGETVIIVGHGRVLKTLLAHFRDSEQGLPPITNCSIVEFTYDADNGLEYVRGSIF